MANTVPPTELLTVRLYNGTKYAPIEMLVVTVSVKFVVALLALPNQNHNALPGFGLARKVRTVPSG